MGILNQNKSNWIKWVLKRPIINYFTNFVASIGVSTEIQWANSQNGW